MLGLLFFSFIVFACLGKIIYAKTDYGGKYFPNFAIALKSAVLLQIGVNFPGILLEKYKDDK